MPPVRPTVASYAAALRDDVAAGAIQLGGILNTNRGQLFAATVQAMSPPPARQSEQLLVEALIMVADEQTDRRRQRTWLAVAGGAALMLGIWLLAGAGRSVR